jgi:hypothetical protein
MQDYDDIYYPKKEIIRNDEQFDYSYISRINIFDYGIYFLDYNYYPYHPYYYPYHPYYYPYYPYYYPYYPYYYPYYPYYYPYYLNKYWYWNYNEWGSFYYNDYQKYQYGHRSLRGKGTNSNYYQRNNNKKIRNIKPIIYKPVLNSSTPLKRIKINKKRLKREDNRIKYLYKKPVINSSYFKLKNINRDVKHLDNRKPINKNYKQKYLPSKTFIKSSKPNNTNKIYPSYPQQIKKLNLNSNRKRK